MTIYKVLLVPAFSISQLLNDLSFNVSPRRLALAANEMTISREEWIKIKTWGGRWKKSKG